MRAGVQVCVRVCVYVLISRLCMHFDTGFVKFVTIVLPANARLHEYNYGFFWIVARFEAINGQGLVRRKNVTLSFFFSCKLFVSVLVLG